MISVKVPLRVSLFGGGTDIPEYFLQNEGMVTGFTIDRYIHIFGSKIDIYQGFKFRLSYRLNEEVNSFDEISHPIFREILKKYNFNQTYHFTTMSDLPSGAGLGSSSSFTVGFDFLINNILGIENSSMELAKNAIYIEREILKEAGGWQDQLHPAFGGINTFRFFADKTIERESIKLSSDRVRKLNNNMYLLFSGGMRKANLIEKSKKKTLNSRFLGEVFDIAKEGESLLKDKNLSLNSIGKLLNKNWELKRSLSDKVSNNDIDDLYNLILNSGAYGAKLCGAGGGGFFVVLASSKVASIIQKKIPNSRMSQIKVEFNKVKRIDL